MLPDCFDHADVNQGSSFDIDLLSGPSPDNRYMNVLARNATPSARSAARRQRRAPPATDEAAGCVELFLHLTDDTRLDGSNTDI
ncbi:hypothetical protein ACKKBG_A31120 [Auxenochlorella protothecoides x Auxenochlorella symbiontica]